MQAQRALSWALFWAAGFALVELLGGLWANSLALLADAAHMISDVGALLLAYAAERIRHRPAHPGMSYGYGHAGTIAAQLNGLGLWLVAGWIGWEAIGRLTDPPEVMGKLAFFVAAAGLGVNLLMLLRLHGAHDWNVRAAFWHVLGDLLGSIAAITSGLLIWLYGWTIADPIASLIVAAILIHGGWRLVRETTRVLMHAAPPSLPPDRAERVIAATPGVCGVHHLHLWTLPDGRAALSAHIELARAEDWPALLDALQRRLAAIGIEHATLQPELGGCEQRSCR